MNTQSDKALKLKDIDKGSAAVSFKLFPQNVNEEGCLARFISEDVEIVPVWMDRDGKVHDEEKDDCILGAHFKVVVSSKPQPKTAKATKASKDSE